MSDPLTIELAASAARTVGGSGDAVDIGALRTAARLVLDVTDVTGSFSDGQGLTVSVQASKTGAGGWQTVASFALVDAAGTLDLPVAGLRRYIRVTWTISGTSSPSFTFSVDGEAHVVFAEPRQLGTIGISPQAFADVGDAVKADALLTATAEISAAFKSKRKEPLSAWGDDVRKMTIQRAVFHVMSHRGFDPGNDADADRLIVANGGYILDNGAPAAVERWIKEVSAGRLNPVGIVDATPSKREGGPRVRSSRSSSEWYDDATCDE